MFTRGSPLAIRAPWHRQPAAKSQPAGTYLLGAGAAGPGSVELGGDEFVNMTFGDFAIFAVNTHIHTYIHTYIHRYIQTYIHTYIHTYVYTYVYIYI